MRRHAKKHKHKKQRELGCYEHGQQAIQRKNRDIWSDACNEAQEGRPEEVIWYFCEKLINYTIKELNNTEEFLMLVHDLKGLNPFFDYKNKPKDLNPEEARSDINKEILAARVR